MSDIGWDIVLVVALLCLILNIAYSIKDSNTVKREPDADDAPYKVEPKDKE